MLFCCLVVKVVTEKLLSEYKTGNQALLDLQQNFANKMIEYPHYEYLTDKSRIDSMDEVILDPVKSRTDEVILDADKVLDNVDKENLSYYNLPIPSVIGLDRNEIKKVLDKIKYYNRSIGQHLSEINKSKKDPTKISAYESQQATLKKYKEAVEALLIGEKFRTGEGLKKRVRLKRSRGRPKGCQTIYYRTPEDLVYKLDEYISSKDSGNTGLDNIIIDILDELLSIKAINKPNYDTIFKNNFPDYIK